MECSVVVGRLLVIFTVLGVGSVRVTSGEQQSLLYQCPGFGNQSSISSAGVVGTQDGQGFRLVTREKPLDCGSEDIKTVEVGIVDKGNANSEDDLMSESGRSVSQYSLSKSGYLLKQEDRAETDGEVTIYFHPNNFCVSKATSSSLTLELCEADCPVNNDPGTGAGGGGDGECLRKCCPQGSILSGGSETELKCVIAGEEDNSANNFISSMDSVLNHGDMGEKKVPQLQVLKAVSHTSRNCSESFQLQDGTQSFQTWLQKMEDKDMGSFCVDLREGSKQPVAAATSCTSDSTTTTTTTTTTKTIGEEAETTSNPFQPVIFKCTSGGVEDNSIEIPPSLRLKYSKDKLDYFTSSLKYSSLFEFELEEKSPACVGGSFTVTVFLANNSATVVDGSLRNVHLNFTPDGYVGYFAKNLATVADPKDALSEEIYFHPENYCISRLTKESISLKMCKSKCFHKDSEKGGNLCIPKCCFLGAVMTYFGPNEVGCEFPLNGDWDPDIYPNEFTSRLDTATRPQYHWNYDGQIHTWNCGNDSLREYLHPKPEFRILSDGRIVTRKPGKHYRVSWEQVYSGEGPIEFCIDGFWNASSSKVYDPSSSQVIVTRCDLKSKNLERIQAVVLRTKIEFFVTLLPCVLIHFATIMVYISLWSKQNVHGWTVMAFATSQFLLYLFYCILLGSVVFGNIGKSLLDNINLCVALGIMHHFFSISSFSWTTIMTFDVWAKLSSMKPTTSQNSKGKKRFLWYACFAVGAPTLVVAIAVIMEFVFGVERDNVIVPGYHDRCLITSAKPFLVYLGLANCLLFGSNLVFASLTFKSLWEAKKSAKQVLRESSKSSTFEKKTILIGKLMLLMGFFLIFEFLFNYGQILQYSEYLAILDIYRPLHALGIFWIFVCSKRTLKQLRERYPRLSLVRRLREKRIHSDASMDTKDTSMGQSQNEMHMYKS